MADPADDPNDEALLSARLRELRSARGLTLDALAARSGVSRAMLSRIERGESSPTAGLLARLCAGLGVTLIALLRGEPELPTAPLARRGGQPLWRDPASGYLRRAVSPAGTGSSVEIVDVELPPGAAVLVDAFEPARPDRHVWVLAGTLEIARDAEALTLDAGDCLWMASGGPTRFRNLGTGVARCAVVTGPAGRGRS